MFPFTDVMDFLTDELTGLSGGSFAPGFIAACSC